MLKKELHNSSESQSRGRYEGEFKDHKRHGHGTVYFENGHRFEGQWKDSEPHGQGTLYYENGNKEYEGELKDD